MDPHPPTCDMCASALARAELLDYCEILTLVEQLAVRAITPIVRHALASLLAFALFSTGCGADDAEVGPLRLSFHGENCTYEGPTELTSGAVTIEFVNEAPVKVLQVNLMRHEGDQTVQNMIDYLGPEPSRSHQPRWVIAQGTWNTYVFGGQTETWEGNLEAGTDTMICANQSPFGVWFGTGLIVED